ncbi:Aspartokinase [Mortierella sp. NVP41]|nr:Aspartokinase [Mortierella sp. NVP41]
MEHPAAASALVPGSTEFIETVRDIRLDHLTAAQDHISDPAILQRTVEEVSPKSKDIIMAVGEKLSCRLVAGILEDQGIETQFVSLENVIEAVFDPSLLDQNFYDYLSRAFATALSGCGYRVPVITGFFGPVPGSLLTSIGRGYTDLAAALIAVGLDAEELQIWKEVDGIFTADPRKVKGARLLDMITPEEASELTYYGSEVIHPFTMEQVVRVQIPIRIKNVMNPNGAGTVIFPNQNSSRLFRATTPWSFLEQPMADDRCPMGDGTRRQPTAVTVKENILVLTVHSNRKSLSHGFFAEVFGMLDRHRIAVDLISTSEVAVSMAMEGDVEGRSMKGLLSGLGNLGAVEVKKDLSIVSLVGREMKNMVGISGRMFSTMAHAGINVEMISQGSSEINISCVVSACHALDAMNAVHQELLLSCLD